MNDRENSGDEDFNVAVDRQEGHGSNIGNEGRVVKVETLFAHESVYKRYLANFRSYEQLLIEGCDTMMQFVAHEGSYENVDSLMSFGVWREVGDYVGHRVTVSGGNEKDECVIMGYELSLATFMPWESKVLTLVIEQPMQP